MEIGDMVVATGAAKDEGTTKRYEDATVPAVSDYEVLSALVDGAEANDEDVHVGPIATDDAFYAETDEYVDEWEAAGLPSPSRWRPPRCSLSHDGKGCAPVRSAPSTATSSKGPRRARPTPRNCPEGEEQRRAGHRHRAGRDDRTLNGSVQTGVSTGQPTVGPAAGPFGLLSPARPTGCQCVIGCGTDGRRSRAGPVGSNGGNCASFGRGSSERRIWSACPRWCSSRCSSPR